MASKRRSFNGWWFCGYWPNSNRDEMPAETAYYFLVSSSPFSKEDAEKDLLEKINKMTLKKDYLIKFKKN